VHDGHLYLGGRWQPGGAADPIVVRSPHDGHEVGTATAARAEDVDTAVRLAAEAFEGGDWATRPAAERLAALEPLRGRYEARLDELARTITLENGSPITFSEYGQVGAVPALLDGFFAAARRLAWDDEVDGAYGVTRVWREPVGVVAAITAWNVPQILLIAKVVPALLAGCSVVVKPAPEAPLDALLLAELLDELDLPRGVVSVLPGGPDVGRTLVAHPLVDKVAFTGSTAVGRQIAAVCGEQLKRTSLELGGKSAAIVLEDADLERTAAGLRFASFMNNGQACAAQTRVLVPRRREAEAVDALAAAVSSFVVGDPLDRATEIGPLVNARQQARVLDYIALGAEEGARTVVGGGPVPAGGCYVAPTLFAEVDNRMRIAQEEIFGPVLVVIPYDDEDDAVRLANDSAYGLGGSVWTRDKAHALALARRIRTGMFGVNMFGPDVAAPFGGYKASGIGREYGRFGLEAFLETKAVHGA
jgi:acyl-CoA reductase-like NAD-dependent aldehyde dehydrogenase